MASLFISHSGFDRAAAQWLCDQLRAAGFQALFVDFDPDQGIPAGRNWERELYAQLRRTDAVIFLASEASVASRWCFAELSLARSLDRPVFPLRLTPGVRLPLLSNVQWIDLTDAEQDGESGFAQLLTGLRSAGLDPADAFAWDPARSPYPGLAPFGPEDVAVFFAREQETERLVELLQPTLQRGPGRFVAIVGPSGSGKSSLLRAGLLPRLARLPERWVLLSPLLPGRYPTRRLAGCLARAFASADHPRPMDELSTVLDRGPAGLIELAGELAELAARGTRLPEVLLVLDQAEELITRTGAREQQSFLDLLGGALGEESPLWVVATLRSEFLATAPERAGLADRIDDSLILEPLSRARLPEVIARPAHRAGLELVPGLVERMVEDTAGGDALPLLAYTLRQLAERAGPEGRIDLTDYAAVGGVIGALQHHADRLSEELTHLGHGPLVVPTLVKLATIGAEGEPTRRRVLRSSLSTEEHAVVDGFVDARLLTSHHHSTDRDDERATGETTVEVAHEALLRQWAPLREAIDNNRTELRLRAELERLAADWDQGRRDESYLLRGGRLATISHWAGDHGSELGPLEQQFLEASQAQAARELDTTRRSNRRLRTLVAGLAALLVVALAASGLAWQGNERSAAQTLLASSRQLAAQANELVETQPDIAILAGLESLSLGRDQQPQPPAGLVSGLARHTHASRLLTGHTGPVWAAAYSPDGRLLATASGDRDVWLWDTAAGQPHGSPLTGHANAVNDVAFSPDGRLLATASADLTVRMWDVAASQPHGPPLTGHTAAVNDAAFSPDGRLLATTSADLTVRMWDVITGQPHGPPLTGHTAAVTGIAFNPGGELLATTSRDRSVRLWDVASGQPHGQPLTGHTLAVSAVAFSPDGNLLATTSQDETVRLWDATTGQPHGSPLTGHTDTVLGVAFSPDNTLLATTSWDRTIRLWDVATGQSRSQPLTGHTNAVTDVVFDPGGHQLATTSQDQTVRLWDVAETYSISRSLIGHTDTVNRVAFSPDGQFLATASDDRTVRLWDVVTGQPHGPPLTGHTEEVWAVAFSPNGQLLATSSYDRTARLWDVASGQPRGGPLAGHTDRVWGVAFSPDGQRLATTSADQTARLWDVTTGQPHGPPLIGHTNEVRGVAFSPDGSLLATASFDNTVQLWNVATLQARGPPLTGHTNAVSAVAFSPDGNLLATTSQDATVRLWDVATGQPHGPPFTGHTDTVSSLAFSHDGNLLATISRDQTLRLWDVPSGRSYSQPLTGHTDLMFGVAFNPDSTLLATGSADGTARLWKPGFASWLVYGCKIVNRNLSMAEWNRLVPDLPYERTCPGLPAGQGAPWDAPAARYRLDALGSGSAGPGMGRLGSSGAALVALGAALAGGLVVIVVRRLRARRAERAGEPQVVAERAGEPQVVAERAGEPQVVAERAGEPQVVAERASEPQLVTERAGEPQTVADLVRLLRKTGRFVPAVPTPIAIESLTQDTRRPGPSPGSRGR